MVPALHGNPIRTARVRLEENWRACESAKATLLAWSMRDDGENNVFPANALGIILRDPIGQINWELAALQEADGTFYLESGLSLVVWLPEDSTDGHWELLSVGSGCPLESESEEEESESESESEEESESESESEEESESESESESEICVNEIDFFGVTLPEIANPEYILGKDANGCLGWVRGLCGMATCRDCYDVRFEGVEPFEEDCDPGGHTDCDTYFDATTFPLPLDPSDQANCHYLLEKDPLVDPADEYPCLGEYGSAWSIELTLYLTYAELIVHVNNYDLDIIFRKTFTPGLCSAAGIYTLYNSPDPVICDWTAATAIVTVGTCEPLEPAQ